MSKRKFFLMMMSLLLIFSLITISCGSDEEDEDENGGAAEKEPTDNTANLPKYTKAGNEGTLTGTIKFEGAAPTPAKIQMEGDDFCAKANPNAASESVVVNGDKFQNVIVYVKEGLKNSFDSPTDPVVLDQKNCQYTPHVVTLQAKQPLKVTTSDETTHNIHPQPKNNKEWNKSQPPKGEPIVETFARAEVIPVKCNQHPWMKAFIGVFNSPFYAVTDKEGKYEIKGLPPGEYTIEAWHEKLGSTTEKVTIAANGTQTLDFSSAKFAVKSASNSSGLKLGAVLTLPCCRPGHEMHK
jgi:hypothetical protein